MAAARSRFWANFLKSLVAVLAGNAVYFLIVDPRLPAHARHRLFQFDLGVVMDAWICLIFYGLIQGVAGWKRRHGKRRS